MLTEARHVYAHHMRWLHASRGVLACMYSLQYLRMLQCSSRHVVPLAVCQGQAMRLCILCSLVCCNTVLQAGGMSLGHQGGITSLEPGISGDSQWLHDHYAD